MKTITTEELINLQDNDEIFTLVNTLAANEFQKTKIPGAINVPQESEDFVTRVEEYAGGKDQPIVVYCASRQCNSSEQAAQKLEEAGFTDVARYTDGAAAWQKEVGEVSSHGRQSRYSDENA